MIWLAAIGGFVVGVVGAVAYVCFQFAKALG